LCILENYLKLKKLSEKNFNFGVFWIFSCKYCDENLIEKKVSDEFRPRKYSQADKAAFVTRRARLKLYEKTFFIFFLKFQICFQSREERKGEIFQSETKDTTPTNRMKRWIIFAMASIFPLLNQLIIFF